MDDTSTVDGLVVAEMRDEHGQILARCEVHNLVTAAGDQGYAGQVLATGKPALPTGMKLGAGSTAPAKTGGGAALGSYVTGANKILDSGYPQAAGGVASYRCTYGPGEATGSTYTEVVLVTDAATNAVSTAANTWARALLSGLGVKGAADTLTITWTHTLQGS